MTNRESYYVSEYNRESEIRAFAWLVKEAAATGKGFVATHIPRNLSDILHGVLPEALVRRLYSKGRITDSNVEIVRVTKNILPFKGDNSPMVVYPPKHATS